MVSLLMQVFVPFPRYAPFLKALTLALFAYVATVFVVNVPWAEVLYRTLMPSISFKGGYVVAVVAVFGTTISPYLFFWQASQEVEEQRAVKGERPLKRAPEPGPRNLQRIRLDTKNFDAIDADKDGTVSLEEVETYMKAQHEPTKN
jgi:Mn2+/Fe2+ NRAMP family transporter